MSGGSLPRTGIGAVAIGGGIAGYHASVPLPIVLVTVALGLVVAGVVLVRLSFRRRRPAGSR